MPIYEFVCKSCEKKFTLLIITQEDQKDIRCPHCGSENVKRVFSPFGSLGGSSKGGCTTFG